MNNKFNLTPPKMGQPIQQTMVVVPSQINNQVQELLWVMDSLIEALDKSWYIGIANSISMGVAKRALFLFLDIKRMNLAKTLEQAQSQTEQIEAQKGIILKRWGQEVLTDMLMEYESLVNKAEIERDGVSWEKVN